MCPRRHQCPADTQQHPSPSGGGLQPPDPGCLHPPHPALTHRFLTLVQPPGAPDAHRAEPLETSPRAGWILPSTTHSGAWHLPLRGMARSLHLWSDPCFREEQTQEARPSPVTTSSGPCGTSRCGSVSRLGRACLPPSVPGRRVAPQRSRSRGMTRLPARVCPESLHSSAWGSVQCSWGSARGDTSPAPGRGRSSSRTGMGRPLES